MNANTQQSFLGRYRLVKVLGQGAMGVVYEAVDTRLNRTVAIKTVLRSHLADETTANEYATRFEREAQAAARLAHANVVTVYDFGEHEDISYIVMEFVRGRELNHAFEQGERFPLPEAIRIMRELLQALDYAHQQGIVHRDIKPANVMLDAGGHVKLTDFGVARVVNANQDRTMPGTLVGTPSYMSPEQILGLAVGSRADLFAAGVILYQFLTGKRPFAGGGPFGVQRKIVQDDPETPSHANPLLPPAFDAVVAKALAKQPEHRYESAAAFAEDLERIGATLPREVPLIDLDLPDDEPAAAPRPVAPTPAAAPAPVAVPHDAPTQLVDLDFVKAAPPPPAPAADAALTTDIPLNDPPNEPPNNPLPAPPADPEATVLMLRATPTAPAPRPPPTGAPAASRLGHLPKPAGGSMEAVAGRPSQPVGTPPPRPPATPPVPVAPPPPLADADQPPTIFVGAPPGAQPRARGPAPGAAPAAPAAAPRPNTAGAAATPAAARPDTPAAIPASAAARAPARTISAHPAPVQRAATGRAPSWLPWAAGAAVLLLALATWWLVGRSSSPRAVDAGYGQTNPASPVASPTAPPTTPPTAPPTASPTGVPADAPASIPPTAAPATDGATTPVGNASNATPGPAGPATTATVPTGATPPGGGTTVTTPSTGATPAPNAGTRPPRPAATGTTTPASRGEAAPRPAGQEARCNDLLQRMQLGEPLTVEQTSYFQTRCTR